MRENVLPRLWLWTTIEELELRLVGFLHFHIIYEYAIMFCGWGGDIYKRVSINLIIVR
jgi:hypothetical protein